MCTLPAVPSPKLTLRSSAPPPDPPSPSLQAAEGDGIGPAWTSEALARPPRWKMFTCAPGGTNANVIQGSLSADSLDQQVRDMKLPRNFCIFSMASSQESLFCVLQDKGKKDIPLYSKLHTCYDVRCITCRGKRKAILSPEKLLKHYK